MSVPGADELFRPTVVPQQVPQQLAAEVPQEVEPVADDVDASLPEAATASRGSRAPSGRVRHDEKMTVYVTAEELLDLEHARLTLRRSGLSIDRGRLVREAIAIALADLDANGDDSDLVHRLTQA